MTKEIRQAAQLCPEELRQLLQKLPPEKQEALEELRLRKGRPVMLSLHGREEPTELLTTGAHLDGMLTAATQQSIHCAQDMLRHCFLTVPGGHRMGICGRAVLRNGELFTVREISSVNLRIAKPCRGIARSCADFLWTRPHSTLIIGPPGRGKTTLLRDLIRQLSERFAWRICVADERMELGACLDGQPQFDLGGHTDILSGLKKSAAIEILLRTMSPEWIALDEISATEDVQAMVAASYCGVSFLATAHAASPKELQQRPVYRQLLQEKIFNNLLIIQKDRQVRTERMEGFV